MVALQGQKWEKVLEGVKKPLVLKEAQDAERQEEEPGLETPYLVGDLEANDLREPHHATTASARSRRRPTCPAMALK